MIKRVLKGAATVAALPVCLVGNALMVPLLKRQLEREKRRADGLAAERNRYRPIAESAEIWMPRIEAERDEAQRKLNLANGAVAEQIKALQERDRARKWSSLWHETARSYRRLWIDYPGELAALTAAHDGATAEYQTLQSEVTAAHAVLDRTTAAKGTTLADRVRQHVELYENAIGAYRDDLRRVEGQLEALRSAAQRVYIALPNPTAKGAETCWREGIAEAKGILNAAIDGTPPVQDAPLRAPPLGSPCRLKDGHSGMVRVWHTADDGNVVSMEVLMHDGPQRGQMRTVGRDEIEVRPPVPGDYPAGDPVTQQWAGIVEGLTKQRDEDTRRLEAAWQERNRFKDEVTDLRNDRAALQIALDIVSRDRDSLEPAVDERNALRREVDTLKRELAEADRVHDGVVAELKARHREVLAERDQTIARLRTKGWAP